MVRDDRCPAQRAFSHTNICRNPICRGTTAPTSRPRSIRTVSDDFGRDPGEWVDEWSASGVGHPWSLSLGHRAADYRAAASLLGVDFRSV